MAKKKKNKKVKEEQFSNKGLQGLSVLKVGNANSPKKEKKQKPKPEPKAPEELSEDDLFLQAMGDVNKIEQNKITLNKSKPKPEKPEIDEDFEAQLELVRIVNGELPFDITYTDEYIEGNVRGLPKTTLKKLKRGEFSIQSTLDLHGKTRTEAREIIQKFIQNNQLKGHRCVLIVHGRGLHSKDQTPVLKSSIQAWFERGRGRIGGSVLAFTSARSVDGGLGAMYVLLRKKR